MVTSVFIARKPGETMSNTNPLQQYFRRPALYLKLPSGGAGYPEGTIDMPETGELPIYPMTAIDEITSRTPDALYSGVAVVELIKSCVPAIKDPWYVNINDLDPILVAIRAATSGSLMEIETTCPSCSEETKYDVNLSAVLAGYRTGDYSQPLIIDDITIKFKPLPYKDINKTNMMQFEIQKMLIDLQNLESGDEQTKRSGEAMKSIQNMAIDLISGTIEYIKVPGAIVFEQEYILEFLRMCDVGTFDKIKEKNLELRESAQSKPLEIECIHCQHEYTQPFTINVTDFFA
jgi:hypothetical protein